MLIALVFFCTKVGFSQFRSSRGYTSLQLPSGEIRKVPDGTEDSLSAYCCLCVCVSVNFITCSHCVDAFAFLSSDCWAVIGQVSEGRGQKKLTKAGERRWRGRRPHVRGCAMQKHRHPHGGKTKVLAKIFQLMAAEKTSRNDSVSVNRAIRIDIMSLRSTGNEYIVKRRFVSGVFHR